MGGGSIAKEHPFEYLGASAMAATINYPLWRASAIGQSGFTVTMASTAVSGRAASSILGSLPPSLSPYVYAFAPPYKGLIATVGGMTWARAAIFWGSDLGRDYLLKSDIPILSEPTYATLLPPLIVSTLVQFVNMPVVRASVTLQNPESHLPNTIESMKHICQNHGLAGLWHGTSAGIAKTVPKYCTAIFVKDYLEEKLPQADPSSSHYNSDRLYRSAIKSATAGVTGAALTNPLDVIRNEMFKSNASLSTTVRQLYDELGYSFLTRGLGKNMIAVAIPVSCTIFFTDVLIQLSSSTNNNEIMNDSVTYQKKIKLEEDNQQ